MLLFENHWVDFNLLVACFLSLFAGNFVFGILFMMQFAYKEIFISSDIVLNLVQSSLLILYLTKYFSFYILFGLCNMLLIKLLISLKINLPHELVLDIHLRFSKQ